MLSGGRGRTLCAGRHVRCVCGTGSIHVGHDAVGSSERQSTPASGQTAVLGATPAATLPRPPGAPPRRRPARAPHRIAVGEEARRERSRAAMRVAAAAPRATRAGTRGSPADVRRSAAGTRWPWRVGLVLPSSARLRHHARRTSRSIGNGSAADAAWYCARNELLARTRRALAGRARRLLRMLGLHQLPPGLHRRGVPHAHFAQGGGRRMRPAPRARSPGLRARGRGGGISAWYASAPRAGPHRARSRRARRPLRSHRRTPRRPAPAAARCRPPPGRRKGGASPPAHVSRRAARARPCGRR